ncbi:hypothetical protein IP92_02926 [Pseudoduganella flava]|uniref:LexA regulated protein n=1 Tax=Pseudoduganella flava TaxID=871742 RepID=A0A562PQ34_9BURK|nr:hypothetical protein [Pseudoduganella flava]QGZ37758.1 hypothetical protein GO485_00930 [Pseudoduganella flava]TWI46567.1 hypothetical protein IP92_02926 [Pseudoduganella flava]
MPEQLTIPGVKPHRKDKQHADRAAKQAAYRERNNLVVVPIQLDADLARRLNEYLVAKGKTKEKSAIIARLIETQLLRKR